MQVEEDNAHEMMLLRLLSFLECLEDGSIRRGSVSRFSDDLVTLYWLSVAVGSKHACALRRALAIWGHTARRLTDGYEYSVSDYFQINRVVVSFANELKSTDAHIVEKARQCAGLFREGALVA